MLAPGEDLTTPVPSPPDRNNAVPLDKGAAGPPVADEEQPEPRSFLLTLLRALGAIHS